MQRETRDYYDGAFPLRRPYLIKHSNSLPLGVTCNHLSMTTAFLKNTDWTQALLGPITTKPTLKTDKWTTISVCLPIILIFIYDKTLYKTNLIYEIHKKQSNLIWQELCIWMLILAAEEIKQEYARKRIIKILKWSKSCKIMERRRQRFEKVSMGIQPTRENVSKEAKPKPNHMPQIQH